jgi:hypothetical protein
MKFLSSQGKIDLSEWTFDTPAINKAINKEFVAAVTDVIKEVIEGAYIRFPNLPSDNPSTVHVVLAFDNGVEDYPQSQLNLREGVEDFIEGHVLYKNGHIDSDFIEPGKALRDEFRAIADLIDEKLSMGGQQ